MSKWQVRAVHTAHDPLDQRVAEACLNQDQSEEVPINTIKGLLKIKFEDERLGIFRFDAM